MMRSPPMVPRTARLPSAARVSSILVAIISALSAIAASTLAAAPGKAGDVARGKQLYMATGCYQCHGTQGEGGGNAGPRLAPTPIPLEAVKLQLRRPRGRMPLYTAVVMPDTDVADIYAYQLRVPKGTTAYEIPMLKGLPASSGSK
jgi:mono/diheme cytochrome c family protein